jgi:hypothetical protein
MEKKPLRYAGREAYSQILANLLNSKRIVAKPGGMYFVVCLQIRPVVVRFASSS